MTRLALFDLDHTLLDGDSNSLWLNELVTHGLVTPALAERQAAHLRDYEAGRLDIVAYLAFQLAVFGTRTLSDWQPVLADFIRTKIAPRISTAARQQVAEHRAAGDTLVIVTATHHLLSTPIGALFELPVVAPRAQVYEDRATGHIEGLVCFGAAKIPAVQQWLGERGLPGDTLAQACFYSDSANDLPLLEAVGRPVVVNPDTRLANTAQARDWPVLRWRVAD
jgi:HAD superfamily hydrolase (TIGR01490 family)